MAKDSIVVGGEGDGALAPTVYGALVEARQRAAERLFVPTGKVTIRKNGSLTLPDTARIYQTDKARTIQYPPQEINDLLRREGGLNPYGDPNYRLVWGGSRLEPIWSWRLGGYDYRPKHFTRANRWVVEMWHAPYMSRTQWERETRIWQNGIPIDVNGPYLYRGDYEYLIHISTRHAEFCEVEVQDKDGDGYCVCGGGRYAPVTAKTIRILMEFAKRSREVTAADRRYYLQEAEEKRKRDFDTFADELIRDAQPPFGGNLTWLSMAGERPYKANAGIIPGK